MNPAAKAIGSLVLTLSLLVGLANKWGNLPPLLYLLNPFTGIWQNSDKPLRDESLRIPGIIGNVEIIYDQQHIPHIFAANDYDAYFAQGYITAIDRLWQMELQSRVAEGTLSEIFSAKTISSDRFFLRAGVRDAAMASFERMQSNPVCRQAMEAYANGVNSYIKSLSFKNLPVEYKIFDVKPRLWKPENTAFIIKLMDYTLSARTQDIKLSRVLAKFGKPVIDDLFPVSPFNALPIVPKDTVWPKFTSPKSSKWIPDIMALEDLPLFPQADENNGSNNWVVSGTKTKSGSPLLANDTHLAYRLPNLFYEIQITVGTNPVYGVSIAGLPSVVLGFNKNLAWGVTNGDTDILDWYKIEFRDEQRTEYKVGENWKKAEVKNYVIKVRGQRDITEHVTVTEFGPIVYELKEKPLKSDFASGLALKWGTSYPGNEFGAFLGLNRAKSISDAKTALESYNSPAQNFVMADHTGQIGIIHRGLFPKRKIGQGRFVMFANDPKNSWNDFYVSKENPQAINPKQGFLVSANQTPANETYPFYLGSEFAAPYRAIRINELISETTVPMDYTHMLRFQNDDISRLAEDVLPHLMQYIDLKQLDENQKTILNILSRWRFQYGGKNIAPTVFEEWFTELHDRLWRPKFGDPDNFAWPQATTTAYLLKFKPKSIWLENIQTLVTETYKATVTKHLQKFGEDMKNWRWGYARKTEFPHISKIPGFGRSFEDIGGSRYSVFANRGNHGPVFRMVVSMETIPRAWILIPGGPSGNPLSHYYDNWLGLWEKGLTKEVLFWQSRDEAKARTKILTLGKENG